MIRHSGSGRNPDVDDWSVEYAGKDNLAFLSAALHAAREGGDAGALGAIVLLGHRDLPGIALRRAQSVLRWDSRPSLWSHALLVVGEQADVAEVATREVTVHSRAGVFPEPAYNAVVPGELGLFADPERDANVALLTFDLSRDEAEKIVERAVRRPNLERLRYDLWETLGVWCAYLWSRHIPSNPLRDGYPMASSALLEYCYEAIDVDLSPGASERNSAPEHLWNAALWWHNEFASLSPRRKVRGWYCVRDSGCSVLDAPRLDDSLDRG
jgi:hypothetical protein